VHGCFISTTDVAIARNIRLGGARQLQFRLDVFNAFNTVVINGRQTQIQYNSPTDLTIRNAQYLADGSLNPDRLTPRTAGFGAATSAQAMRNLQLQIRFQFQAHAVRHDVVRVPHDIGCPACGFIAGLRPRTPSRPDNPPFPEPRPEAPPPFDGSQCMFCGANRRYAQRFEGFER
jgi:hypothetical protein